MATAVIDTNVLVGLLDERDKWHSDRLDWLIRAGGAAAISISTMNLYGHWDNFDWSRRISIKELLHLIARLTWFEGESVWDTSKPDDQPRLCLDTSKAESSSASSTQAPFEEGLRRTIGWYESPLHAGTTRQVLRQALDVQR